MELCWLMQRNTAPYKQLFFVNEICHGVSSAKVTVHSHVLLSLDSQLRIPREHFGLQSATGPYVCGHGGITTVNLSPDLHAVYTAGM